MNITEQQYINYLCLMELAIKSTARNIVNLQGDLEKMDEDTYEGSLKREETKSLIEDFRHSQQDLYYEWRSLNAPKKGTPSGMKEFFNVTKQMELKHLLK